MSGNGVILRPATLQDIDPVFRWANDPITRQASFSTEEIRYADHVAWFRQQLDDPDRNAFIAETAQVPVAIVRLDRAPDSVTGIVSLNIAPEARGRGISHAALDAAAKTAAELGFVRLRAFIRPENTASQRAFSRAGYALAEQTTVGGHPAWVYVRRC